MQLGKAPERLDEKLIATVNTSVRCFRDLKEEQAGRYENTLSGRGHMPGS